MVVYSLSHFLKHVSSSTLCLILSHFLDTCSILSFFLVFLIHSFFNPSFCFFCPSMTSPSFHLSFNFFLSFFSTSFHFSLVSIMFRFFYPSYYSHCCPSLCPFFVFFPQPSLMSPSQYVSRFPPCVFLLLSFFLSPKLSGTIFSQ